jgi:FecR protein
LTPIFSLLAVFLPHFPGPLGLAVVTKSLRCSAGTIDSFCSSVKIVLNQNVAIQREFRMVLFRRFTALVLSSLLAGLPALAAPQTGPSAGQINALIPAATKNSKAAKAKDELNWNDLLQTDHAGRVRAGLQDGSILSLGSDSELRIVQHDNAAQQTSLEMDFGRMRSQVVKISKPGGKFEVKTPNAVIGVIGTDFYVGFESNRTTVICYQGQVLVTPLGNATATNNSGQSSSGSNAIAVGAGQMVVITSELPPAGFQTSSTPPDVLQSSLSSTDLPSGGGNTIAHHGHGLRWTVIGVAVAVGLGVGIGIAVTGGGSSNKNRVPNRNP